MLVGRYRERVYSSVHQFEGHVGVNQAMGFWRCSLIGVAERMPSDSTWPELERVRVSLYG